MPDPGELTALDQELLAAVEGGFESVAQHMEAVHLRSALGEAMRLAGEVNKYLDQTAPWMAIKSDKAAAARAIFTAIRASDSLKLLLAPFLPFTSQQLHTYLGYSQPLFANKAWKRLKMTWGCTLPCVTIPKRRPGAGNPANWPPGRCCSRQSRCLKN